MAIRESSFPQETADVWLVLITIEHSALSIPIRVVNNHESVISAGEEFVGFPFKMTLPSSLEDAPPSGRLVIDNVSQDIVQNIRQINSPASVTIQVIDASTLDIIQFNFPDFQLRDVKANVIQVTGDLTLENFVNEPYPAGTFSPSAFPGLF